MFGRLYSIMHMSSTFASPWRWLQFATETCRSQKKPTVQLVGDKLAWILACILLSLWSRVTIFFHGAPVPHSAPTTITTN